MFNLPVHKAVSRDKPQGLSLPEIELLISSGLERELSKRDISGQKIGILAGSRGIRNIKEIISFAIKHLRRYGAEVVILPAMGSHGGATAEGQSSLLAQLGIDEAAVGAPVVSSMEVTVVGDVEGHPVYVNRPALDLDWIVPVNRIKAHTDFHGPYESGLVKMLVIGLGKRAQAEAIHRHGTGGLRELIPRAAQKVLEHVRLLGAIAIVENKWDETAIIEVLNKENLFSREMELLQLSKSMLPQIPVSNLDVLVVAEMGKNISGVGMDPNVTGRMRIGGEPDSPWAPKRIVALDLTAESEGNALGMGVADVITKRLYDKTDLRKTYINTITSTFLERCFIPVIASTDEEAVRIAVQTCGRMVNIRNLRLALIKNTLDLSQIYISPALLAELPESYQAADNELLMFDDQGNLALLAEE